MARKKQPKTELFNEKKHDEVYDFGDVKIVDSWDDITLQMMCDLWKVKADKAQLLEDDQKKAKAEKKDEPDSTLDKYNVTDKDILSIFSTIDPEKIDLLPVPFYEQLMGHLSFVLKPYDSAKPTKYIEVNGMTLLINDRDTLRLKEFTDASTVIHNNKFDYPSLLAVLCRQKTGTKTDNVTGQSWDVNEEYTEEFANKIFDGRRKMFAEMPVAKVMPLISFFLLKGLSSSSLSQRSLTTLAHQLRELVENIENSAESMDLPKSSKKRLMKTLKKYKEQINSTL